MSDAVLVGLISALGVIISQVVIAHAKSKEVNATWAAHEQKQQDAIDNVHIELAEVKKRLDMHNGYAEKFASASKDIAIAQRDIEFIKEQLKSLIIDKLK